MAADPRGVDEGWWTDEYAEETAAAMNYGQGYADGVVEGRRQIEAETAPVQVVVIIAAASFVTGLLLGAAVARVL